MDAYNAVVDLRDIIGEETAKHWSDRMLLNCLNRAQARLYLKLSMTMGDWFVKSKVLSFSSSVASLPDDCAKPLFLKNETNNEIVPINLSSRDQDHELLPSYEGLFNSTHRAFLYGNYVKVNYTLSGNLTLWYEQRNTNLHMGTAAAGGTDSLTLSADSPRSYVDDYYNGLDLLVVSGTGSGTLAEITDYTGSTGVLTLSGTFDSDSIYGILSNLPEPGYDAWIARAAFIALSKPSGVIDKETIAWVREDMREAEDTFENWISTRVKDNIFMREGR
jgi:hypothetical protein